MIWGWRFMNQWPEYDMLRIEIMEYLKNLQTVRNMMFIVAGTAFGFGINNHNPYLFLLPIVVIFSSYIVSLDYWNCTVKACTYLQAFYEEDSESPYHWETRQQRLPEFMETPFRKVTVQHIPYLLFYVVSLALYGFNIDYTNADTLPWQLTLAIATLVAGWIVFSRCRPVDAETYLDAWRRMKNDTMDS